MDTDSNPIGQPGCVAHFLLNRGALALSGEPVSRPNGVAIDVTSIAPSVLDAIDLRGGGLCVLASGAGKWRFDLGPLSLATEAGVAWLAAPLPPAPAEIPTRKARRRNLQPGAAHLRIDGVDCPIINLSEGGCAFMAPPAAASRLPLHAPVRVEIICGQALALQTEATIARVSYEVGDAPGSDAVVSCRFLAAQAGELLDALA